MRFDPARHLRGSPARARAVLIGTSGTIRLARRQLDLIEDGPVAAAWLPMDDGGTEAEPEGLARLTTLEDLRTAARQGVSVGIVSLPASMTEEILAIRSALARAGLTERFLPPLGELLGRTPPYPVGYAGAPGSCAWSSPRIDLSSLIGREPRAMDQAGPRAAIAGKRVVITGAGGSIGSELARAVAGLNPELLILVERGENALFDVDRRMAAKFPGVARRAVLHDVVNHDDTLRLFVQLRPDVVFHAAAHKHVPLMEDHPALALSNNVFGTKSVADAAAAVGVERFVMVSTDKAVRPTSIMGATKRLAELYVQSLHARLHVGARPGDRATRMSMVRFGNVLGSSASVLEIWSAQLAEGGPITITDPRMTRYFMTIPEAASLVVHAGSLDAGQPASPHAPVYVLDMGEPVRIMDLAARFARAHGYEPVFPAGVDAPAARASGLPTIPIVLTGIRPGEKLHEELAYSAEELRPTACPAIRSWTGAPPASGDAASMVVDLAAAAALKDRGAVTAAIRRHLPEMNAHAA